MKRVKSVEVTTFRGERYLRIWQYAAKGGKSLATQVRIPEGEKAGDLLRSESLQTLLKDEFGLKSI